jgi:hypothetical protein
LPPHPELDELERYRHFSRGLPLLYTNKLEEDFKE